MVQDKSGSPLRAQGGWWLPPSKPWMAHGEAFRELMKLDWWAALHRSYSCPLLSYLGIFQLKNIEFLDVGKLRHFLPCGENRRQLHYV